MPPLHHSGFFKHLCWRCSIRSMCSKISVSRLFLRRTPLELCQLVKDMKEVCKNLLSFQEKKTHTHTHLQLWTVKARWKETADWTFQEWQLKDTVADLWQRLKTNSGTLKIHRVWEPGREPLVYTTDLIHFIVSCTLLCFMQVPLMSAECAICTSLSDKQSQSRI